MSDDLQTWWEIPSIVHFCKFFSLFSKDICPIDITEFEHAIEENSPLLTNMAIRFIKICGYYDPDTNKWWDFMKHLFQIKCIGYNFELSLDSVTYFDDLTCKHKVEALYILCHFILDIEEIQLKIALNSKIWNQLNVKPLGYDLNNSVYWYFGTTRLYREDFDDVCDISNSSNSLMLHDTHKSHLTEPCLSGIVGSGKWNIICDDNNESWYSFADTIEHSKNGLIRSLHKSVCSIIRKLPSVKRNKSHYKYIKTHLSSKNIRTRFLRSRFVIDEEPNEILMKSRSTNHKQFSLIVNSNQTKYGDPLEKTNEDICYQNQNTPHSSKHVYKDEYKQIKSVNNETTMKLRFQNGNKNQNISTHIKDISGFDCYNLPTAYEDCFKREARVIVERIDLKNMLHFKNLNQTSIRLKSRNISGFDCYYLPTAYQDCFKREARVKVERIDQENILPLKYLNRTSKRLKNRKKTLSLKDLNNFT